MIEERFLRYRVDGHLAPWVDSIWLQECPAPGGVVSTVVLPAARCEVIIRYGDPYVHLESPPVIVPPASFHGLRLRSIRVAATGCTGLLIVNFRPWAASQLFGPAASLVDGMVDLEALWPIAEVHRLLDTVATARSSDERVAAMCAVLHDRIGDARPDGRLVAAVREIARAQPLAVVATRCGVSSRHLARSFGDRIGVRPKQLARLVRFQRALRMLRDGARGVDVATALDYTDQAHLGRDMHDFVGLSPSLVRQRRVSERVDRVFNRGHGGRPDSDRPDSDRPDTAGTGVGELYTQTYL